MSGELNRSNPFAFYFYYYVFLRICLESGDTTRQYKRIFNGTGGISAENHQRSCFPGEQIVFSEIRRVKSNACVAWTWGRLDRFLSHYGVTPISICFVLLLLLLLVWYHNGCWHAPVRSMDVDIIS